MYSARGYIEYYTLQRVGKSPVHKACFIGLKKQFKRKKSSANDHALVIENDCCLTSEHFCSPEGSVFFFPLVCNPLHL